MSDLRSDPAYRDMDEFYALLIDATRGLDDNAAVKLNAKLVLLLANHIGDLEVVRQAITAAQKNP
jgi:hypothetical protein